MCEHGISRHPKAFTSLLNVKNMQAVGLRGMYIRSGVRLILRVSMAKKQKYCSERSGFKSPLVGIFF